MKSRIFLLFLPATVVSVSAVASSAPDFVRDVLPIVEEHCFDCHGDETKPKGGVNLEKFRTNADVIRDRQIWASVFEKVESHQMPPPKRNTQPTAAERARLLAWVNDLALRPDAALGARDPGRPLLRRLTRLEYNNSVRDLLGLNVDIVAFPERIHFVNKDYFHPETGSMGERLEVRLREFGGGQGVLLRQSGLPGDNRAEFGFRNRGEANNFSGLTLENYLSLATDLVMEPSLPGRSKVFAELLGMNPLPVSLAAKPARDRESKRPGKAPVVGGATREFARDFGPTAVAKGDIESLAAFRLLIENGWKECRGGVVDFESHANANIAAESGKIEKNYGTGNLVIGTDSDLWIAGFATTQPTSKSQVLTNKTKGAKTFTLSFTVRNGNAAEGIERLGVCVLGRTGQQGIVTVSARFDDGTEHAQSSHIQPGAAGTTLFTFAAPPKKHIVGLRVDGSQFSGDYVLVDDIGFVTDGKPQPRIDSGLGETPVVPAAPERAAPAPLEPPKVAPIPFRSRLTQFASRAFRRPVSGEEMQRYTALYDQQRAAGRSEADAMRAAVAAILSSPGFLFLSEPVRPGGNVRPLDDFEMASRLAYFLWASIPDAALLEAAAAGSLTTPAGLEAQVQRMIKDSRIRELSESFATQWLRMDQLYTAKPDKELFKAFYAGPQGKDTLHGAMLIEALLLFETVLVENRSILEFIDADYTWLNQRLAAAYGIAIPNEQNVASASAENTTDTREVAKPDKDRNNRWIRVPLPDRNRGGYITMGGPLTVTSLPFRTSPVKRGAWILETVFNRPPSEPKVAFAVENDTKEAAQQMSIRQRFESHRNQAACFSCHIRLDPPGFALERFDGAGRWRDQDSGHPVDAQGEWNGVAFDGPAEYKAALLLTPGEFTRGFIEHLLSYALGRKLEIYDMPVVNEIQTKVAADGNRLQSVILEIVKSYPFRYVRNVKTAHTAQAGSTQSAPDGARPIAQIK